MLSAITVNRRRRPEIRGSFSTKQGDLLPEIFLSQSAWLNGDRTILSDVVLSVLRLPLILLEGIEIKPMIAA